MYIMTSSSTFRAVIRAPYLEKLEDAQRLTFSKFQFYFRGEKPNTIGTWKNSPADDKTWDEKDESIFVVGSFHEEVSSIKDFSEQDLMALYNGTIDEEKLNEVVWAGCKVGTLFYEEPDNLMSLF